MDAGAEVASAQVFVGREAELAVAATAIEAVRSASPQIVWIEGNPGIGKTAFLHRVVSSLEDVTVLRASGEESETALDYGVVLQLFAQAAPGASWGELQHRFSDPSRVSTFAIGAELLAELGSLQSGAPVVIAIDDAHWLDGPSAGALLFALRRLHGDRVLVLIATRPEGPDHLGTGWTRLLADPYRVQHIGLAGLSAQDIAQLSDSLGAGRLEPAASERLRLHTDGHPLYVRALLSELEPVVLQADSGALPAPHSFSTTILARLTELPADAQNLMAAASVAGPRCQLDLALSVARVGDPLAALEDSVAAGLLTLVATSAPQEIAFAHPLVRAAVYDDLSPTRRRELHLAYAALTSGPRALAHRVAASPGGDEALAMELWDSAESEIGAGRVTAGVDQLLAASRIGGTSKTRDFALLRAVECLTHAGNTRATRMLDSVMACGDTARRSYTVALLDISTGSLFAAREALLEVIDRPDYSEDPSLAGRVAASLAITSGFLKLGDEAVRWANHALEVDDLPRTARTTAMQGLALGLTACGRGDEAIAKLADLSPSPLGPPFEVELLASRGSLKNWWGDLKGAAADLSAVVAWSRSGVALRSLPNAYGSLAEVEYRLGRWDDGLTHADIAVSLAEENERAFELAYIHAVSSQLYAARGDWSSASEHADAAGDAVKQAPLPVSFFYAAEARAHLGWVRADWEAVLQALELLVNPLDRMVAGLSPRVVRSMIAEALLFSGRLDEADGMLDGLADQLAAIPFSDSTSIDLWRLRGALAHARGNTDDAEAAFEQGKVVAAAVQAPLAAALLELGRGQFLRRTGKRRRATAALQSARRQFAALGAQPFCDRCDTELSACGIRSVSPTSDNRYGLTPREHVVARLVASGKTNREVAGELYLSTKAIEYHLSHVFGKVGVRSRKELAGRLNVPQADPSEPVRI